MVKILIVDSHYTIYPTLIFVAFAAKSFLISKDLLTTLLNEPSFFGEIDTRRRIEWSVRFSTIAVGARCQEVVLAVGSSSGDCDDVIHL